MDAVPAEKENKSRRKAQQEPTRARQTDEPPVGNFLALCVSFTVHEFIQLKSVLYL